MDFETIIDWVLKCAGLIDAMFFIAYAIGSIIDWIRSKRG